MHVYGVIKAQVCLEWDRDYADRRDKLTQTNAVCLSTDIGYGFLLRDVEIYGHTQGQYLDIFAERQIKMNTEDQRTDIMCPVPIFITF